MGQRLLGETIADDIQVGENVSVGGTLEVTGASTLTGLLTAAGGVVAGVSEVKTALVTLTSAQILLLATTQIELVAAQGATKAIEFLGAMLRLNYGSNVFTESADNLTINYTDDSGVVVSDVVECTGFIDQTADTITFAVPIKDPIVASSACLNQALVIDNNNANFGGNAGDDSAIDVYTSYRVHTLTV